MRILVENSSTVFNFGILWTTTSQQLSLNMIIERFMVRLNQKINDTTQYVKFQIVARYITNERGVDGCILIIIQ